MGGQDFEIVDVEQDAYRACFELNARPMWLFDPATLRFLRVNDAAVQRYGYSREEFAQMTVLAIRPAEDRGRFRGDLQASEAQQAVRYQAQSRHCTKSGELLHVDILSQRVLLNGAPAWLVQVTDVSGRVRLMDELREAQKHEAIARVTVGVVHDFKNMLTVIAANTRLMRRQGGVSPEHLDAIDEAIERSTRLSQQLLAFARPGPAERTIEHEVDAVIAGEASLLRHMLGADHRLEIGLAAPGALVALPAGALAQVLANLVGNAHDAMVRPGQVAVRTRQQQLVDGVPDGRARRPGRYVVIDVVDDGEGMSQAVRERALEPYFTTKGEHGTGLGLMVVVGVVQAAGGWIELTSEAGKGTTVSLWLPLHDDRPSA